MTGIVFAIAAGAASAWVMEEAWRLRLLHRTVDAGRAWLASFIDRRERRRALTQWPSALLFLSGAVSAGATLEEALAHLGREAPPPLGLRVRRACEGPMLTTEARVRRLMDDPPLRFARAALLLYVRTGGRVARLLETTAAVLQERVEAEARVKALTAQGRVSAWIVALTPVALFGMLSLLAPDLAAPMVQTLAGRCVLLAAALLVGLGLFLAQKLARVET